MKVYIAMFKDRHIETEAEVWTTLEGAISSARGWITEIDRHDQRAEHYPSPAGWLYYVTTHTGGPSAWVYETELRS